MSHKVCKSLCNLLDLANSKYLHAFLNAFLRRVYKLMPEECPHDRNMQHPFIKLIKYVVSDGSTYVDIGMIYRNGVKSTRMNLLQPKHT